MAVDNDQNYMINLRLLKLFGFYQLLNPNNPMTILGYNVHRIFGTLCFLYSALFGVTFYTSIYYTLYDSVRVINYLMLFCGYVFGQIRLYFILRNSNRLWELLSCTAIDLLPYSGHQKNILIYARAVCIKISQIITLSWTALLTVWILTPILIQGNYMSIKFEDDTYNQYRCNAMSLVFPVTDEFYNNNFMLFYLLETLQLLIYSYSTMMFDCLIISMGVTIIHQLKMMALSFSTIDRNNSKVCFKNEIKLSLANEESSDLNNLIMIIQDHQILVKNIDEVFDVIRSVIFFQLSFESILITLLPSIVVLNFNKGVSLTSTDNVRLILTTLVYSSHMFTICYLFTIVNRHIDSINFSLYSSNWTEMSIKLKKLILLAMQLNNTERLKLKVTSKMIINLEMFAIVVHFTYKIVSVLINVYK